MRFEKLTVSFFLIIVAISCAQPLVVSRYENQQYSFTPEQNTAIDSTIYRQIRPYHDSVVTSMSRVLGRTATSLLKTELSNFVADACDQQLNKDISHQFDFIVLNRGGLRRTLPEGDITVGDVYELMPFDNTLVVAKLDGNTTYELCQWIGKRGTDPVAGITMSFIDGTGAQNILIRGIPIDTTRSYWVVTNSYMVNGGDHFDMFLKRQAFHDTRILVRDALINQLVQAGSDGKVIEPDYIQRTRK